MTPLVPVLIALILGGGISYSYAHTTVHVEEYAIEVGWGTEPPVVGYRNTFVFQIFAPGEREGVKTGIPNAFAEMEAVAKFGGVSKKLEIISDVTPGHYFSNTIPTKTGSFSIHLTGEIRETPVDVEIPIEDVETTSILDFPPSTASDGDTAGMKNALSSLQRQVALLESELDEATASLDAGPAYDVAVFAISLGAAGVILSVVAMVRGRAGMGTHG